MKFIGIDLGWSSGASGLCCLNWENDRLQFIECDRKQSVNDILTWIDTQISPTEPAIIAVDAPTIIANLTGMREADKLTPGNKPTQSPPPIIRILAVDKTRNCVVLSIR